jgi:hypothetical protein
MPVNLHGRADYVRQKVELLNGADSIGLIEFLLLKIGYEECFIKACEAWIKARGE